MSNLHGPVTILAVESVTRNTKNGPKPVFNIKVSDGKTWDTWDAPTAQQASQFQLQGQSVLIDGEIVQNGQYTNYRLKSIAPASPSQAPASTPAPAPVAIPVATVNPDDKDKRITRLSAASTGFGYAAQNGMATGDAWELVKQIELYALSGQPDLIPVEESALATGSGEIDF